MFKKKILLKTEKTVSEVTEVISNNLCTHSPVLNTKDINVLKTDKKLCGIIEKNTFTVWETLYKKTVLLPIAECEIADNSDIREINIILKLPRYNEMMLKIWFLLLLLFIFGNLCYLPFCGQKLYFMINFLSAAVAFVSSYFGVRKIFNNRAEKIILKLKEILN